MTIDMNGTTNEPHTMEYEIAKRDPAVAAILSDRYLKTEIEMWYTMTPTLAFTSTQKAAVSPITRYTWTPFPTFWKSTTTPTYNPLPTHRATTPSPDWTPGPEGLTQAESANAGIHTYSASGVAFGSCTYSGYGDKNQGSFTFTKSDLTMASVDGKASLKYIKISENNYQLKGDQEVTTITFYVDGWDMVVTKNGEACSHQTFLLK